MQLCISTVLDSVLKRIAAFIYTLVDGKMLSVTKYSFQILFMVSC